ncbi:MAG: thioredoxin family protein [Clostridiales bacterium]|nr:thioredoxin family protein [Clostridiales bacterium]
MKKKTLLRIMIPLFILAIAGGLWLAKNNERQQAQARQEALTADNPAFRLTETSVDLDSYLSHQLPLILDFGAEDCPPCQVMRPALEKAHADHLGRAVIKFFDVWEHPDAAREYPIMVIPTQVIFNADGSPYEPSEEVRSALDFEYYNYTGTEDHALTVHVGILDEADFQLILADMGVRYE